MEEGLEAAQNRETGMWRQETWVWIMAAGQQSCDLHQVTKPAYKQFSHLSKKKIACVYSKNFKWFLKTLKNLL